MKILYIFFIAVFIFGNSVSSFANRDRSDRRDRNRLESRHEKTERKSNQEARRGRSNSGRSGGSARSGLIVATKNESSKVEKAVVEEEAELKIAPIKKTTQYPNYSRDLQDIISNASSQYSKVGRDVKRYSKSPSSCITDFTECVSQTSICDKEMKKCLNSDKLELEKTTWFCQKKFLDKCHPDSHETMYERFLSDLAGFIEARRQRKLASEEQARQIALAKQKAYDEKQIYKLACKNAGGLLTDNGGCGFSISLFYPGGNVEQILTGKGKKYCNATTMGYDPIEKKKVEQTKKRNTITAIGAAVGLVGGAIAGHEIEEDMEKKEEELEDYLTIRLKKTGLPTERQELYDHCKGKNIEKKEIGMREGKCIRLIDAFYEDLEYEVSKIIGLEGYNKEIKKCQKFGNTEEECLDLVEEGIDYDKVQEKFIRKLKLKGKKVTDFIEEEEAESFVGESDSEKVKTWFKLTSEQKTKVIKNCFIKNVDYDENEEDDEDNKKCNFDAEQCLEGLENPDVIVIEEKKKEKKNDTEKIIIPQTFMPVNFQGKAPFIVNPSSYNSKIRPLKIF